jgi:hypothetical protein
MMRITVEPVIDCLDAGDFLSLNIGGDDFSTTVAVNMTEAHNLIADLQKNLMKLVQANKEHAKIEKKYSKLFGKRKVVK